MVPDPLRLNEQGLDALEAGEVEQALQYLKAATGADPSEPALWMNLAKAHRTAADDEGERAALEKVLEIDQLHLMARLRLAELHERRSEPGAATDHWAIFLGVCANIPNHTAELAAMIDMHGNLSKRGAERWPRP